MRTALLLDALEQAVWTNSREDVADLPFPVGFQNAAIFINSDRSRV